MNKCPHCGCEVPNESQRKGGKKRWDGVTKERRSEIAKKAVAARWAKRAKSPSV